MKLNLLVWSHFHYQNICKKLEGSKIN